MCYVLTSARYSNEEPCITAANYRSTSISREIFYSRRSRPLHNFAIIFLRGGRGGGEGGISIPRSYHFLRCIVFFIIRRDCTPCKITMISSRVSETLPLPKNCDFLSGSDHYYMPSLTDNFTGELSPRLADVSIGRPRGERPRTLRIASCGLAERSREPSSNHDEPEQSSFMCRWVISKRTPRDDGCDRIDPSLPTCASVRRASLRSLFVLFADRGE